MRPLLRDNGLSIAMSGLFFVIVSAQSVIGLFDYNSTRGAWAASSLVRSVPRKRGLRRSHFRELGVNWRQHSGAGDLTFSCGLSWSPPP
jgi:hypothetical protein